MTLRAYQGVRTDQSVDRTRWTRYRSIRLIVPQDAESRAYWMADARYYLDAARQYRARGTSAAAAHCLNVAARSTRAAISRTHAR